MLLDMRPKKVDRLVPGYEVMVDVTADDIRDASRGNAVDCAIVRALNRATGVCWRIQGPTSGAYCEDLTLRASLPTAAKDFIRVWDEYPQIGFAPFRFRLVLEKRKRSVFEETWQEGLVSLYSPKLPA